MTEGQLTVEVYGEARGSHGLAGGGVIVRDEHGREHQREGFFFGVCTPPQARYRAIVEGLRVSQSLHADSIEVVTGDEAAFRQLTGLSLAYAPEVAGLYAEAVAMLTERPFIHLRLADEAELDRVATVAAVAIESRGRRSAPS